MRGRKFNITGRITSPISDSPVYQPVNPIPDWYLPVNIIRSKAMCSLSGIRTEIPEHTGRSSRHEISAPGRNTALSRVLKVPNRHLQTPQELHPPLAGIGSRERCAAMMRTPFQHGGGKRDSGEYVSACRGQYSPRAPAESSDHYFRRRHSGFQARHNIKPIKQRAGILRITQTNAVQRGVSRSGFQWSSVERLETRLDLLSG